MDAGFFAGAVRAPPIGCLGAKVQLTGYPAGANLVEVKAITGQWFNILTRLETTCYKKAPAQWAGAFL
jgi:hypothetical protein